MLDLIKKRFAVATKCTTIQSDDKWESTPIGYDEAKQILIFNDWTSTQADEDLSRCPDEWILVNNMTQIC